MASQGCIPELLQDMRTALSISTTGPSLSKDEYLHIARAIRTGYAFPALQHDGWGSNDWARELRRCRGGRLAILALADGIWRMARGYPGTISQRLGRLCIALATARKALI